MSFLLAQLTLAGKDAQCRETDSVAGRSDVSASAADAVMDMGGAARSDPAAGSGADCADCAAPADHVPCGLPGAPGAPCAQMASCATVSMALVRSGPALALAQGTAPVSAATAFVPPGPTSAPDVPPPRA